MQVKTDIEGLYKDQESGGLINKDNEALQAYKKRKQRLRQTQTMELRIAKLEEEVSILKDKLNELTR